MYAWIKLQGQSFAAVCNMYDMCTHAYIYVYLYMNVLCILNSSRNIVYLICECLKWVQGLISILVCQILLSLPVSGWPAGH
jgi:hypothetical protein